MPLSSGASQLIFHKRFIRIVIVALSFILITSLLVWRQNGVGSVFPRLRRPQAPEIYPYSTTSSFFPAAVDPKGKTADELCKTFPKHMLNYVQPVLKMGHGEDRAKIEAQLDSASACFGNDDLLIFSDLSETIRGYDIIDILADLPVSYRDNVDFQSYVWQKEMKENGTLDKDEEATKRIDGWHLDKYKFLPMVERAWISKPNKAFYFFYETDTYVFWDNAFRFLQTFDPDTPLYMGSPSPGRHDTKQDIRTWFANGGPGFVLSRGAIKALLHREVGHTGQYVDPPLNDKWYDLLKGECCGDSVMGWTLWNASVPLQGYWPLFNPHPLHSIPYSDGYWCQPTMTLHKTSPKDMVSVWRWEFGQRQLGRPMLYADLWKFQHPGQPGVLENWDNGDWDSWIAPGDVGIDSFDSCGKYCKDHGDCVQWNWHGKDENVCILMRSIRYGVARKPQVIPEPDQKDDQGNIIPPDKNKKERWVDFKSGWVEEKVERWRNERTCDVVQWVGPSITRIF